MSDQNNGSQGQLFSDAAVGAPAYDEVDTDLVGYRGPTACAAAGITYRQLDYWARTGLVAPSVRSATGSGTQRLYSFRDILVLKVVKRLLDTGVSLQNIRKAVDHLRNRGIKDLANVTLFSDGATVYECTSAEEVVDLLAGGQGVFGIAVSGALRELSGELAELPAERIDGGPDAPRPTTSCRCAAAAAPPSDLTPPDDTAARCRPGCAELSRCRTLRASRRDHSSRCTAGRGQRPVARQLAGSVAAMVDPLAATAARH